MEKGMKAWEKRMKERRSSEAAEERRSSEATHERRSSEATEATHERWTPVFPARIYSRFRTPGSVIRNSEIQIVVIVTRHNPLKFTAVVPIHQHRLVQVLFT